MSVTELVSDFMHPAIYGCLSNYFTDAELDRIAIRSGIHDRTGYTKKAFDLGLCVRCGCDGSQVFLRVRPMIDFFRTNADLKYADVKNAPTAATTFAADFGFGSRMHPLAK